MCSTLCSHALIIHVFALSRGLSQDPEKRSALARSNKILENLIEIMKSTVNYSGLETREWVLAAIWAIMLVTKFVQPVLFS
jgi:hypothetical protein